MTYRYKDALMVQDASNPSGVARLLVRVIDEVQHAPGYGGTAEISRDEAVILIVAKLADMVRLDYVWPRDVYERAESKSKSLEQTVEYPLEAGHNE